MDNVQWCNVFEHKSYSRCLNVYILLDIFRVQMFHLQLLDNIPPKLETLEFHFHLQSRKLYLY